MSTCPLCTKNPKARSVNYCAPCNNVMTIYRQHRFKQACIDYKGGSCVHCGAQHVQSAMCFRVIHASGNERAFSKNTGAVPLTDDVIAELDSRLLVCSNCERTHYRSSSKTTKRKLDALAFLGSACSICNYADSPAALEFHHKDGRGASSKALQISDYKSFDIGELYDELSKCVILCANCHSTEHFVQAQRERLDYVKHEVIDHEWRALLLEQFQKELL